MLSVKPWKLDTMLLFGVGLFSSLLVGMVAGLWLRRFYADLSADDMQFFGFVVGGVCFHGGTLFLTHRFLKLHDVTWSDFLGWRSPTLPKSMLFALGVGTLALPLAIGLNKLSELLITALQMKAVEQPSMRILEVSVGPGQRLCFAVAAIILAPVVEEILFRGMLYPFLKQNGWPRLALWGTALLFAAIHANLMTFVPLTFLALVLTWLYEKTDTLLAPMVAHAFFNGVNFVVFIYHKPLTEWLNGLILPLTNLRLAA